MFKKVLSGALALTMSLSTCVLPNTVFAEEDIGIAEPDLHTHSYVATDEIEPTCEEPGKQTYECEICGDTYVEEFGEPTGHDYEEVVTPATCTEDGAVENKCKNCGKVESSEIIEKTGHKYVCVATVMSSCYECGKRAYECEVCKDTFVEDYGTPRGHIYTVKTLLPTCTENGLVERECMDCGFAEETEIIDALGHDYVATVTGPTCTENGYTTYVCSNCEDSYIADETEALGHDYVATVTEPTCTENGYTTYVCSSCGTSYIADETEAFGHNYKETVVEPTYLEDGYTLYECAVCGDTYKDNIVEKLTIAAISELKVSATSTDSIKLNWNEVENADGYIVYRFNNDANKFSRVAVTDATTYTNTKLASGTAYTYAVRPYVLVDGKQILNFGGYPTVTGFTNLRTVSGFKVDSVSNNAVKLSWTSVEGATGYYFYRYNDTNKKWVRIATIESNSYTDKGLKGGTTYKYAVKAYMTVDEKAVASAKYPTVTATTNLDVVANFKVASTSATAIKLTWDKVNGATGYYFYRFNTKTNKWVRIATVAKNTYTDSKLASGTAYKYAVKPYKTVDGKNVTITKYPTVSAVTNPAIVTGLAAPVFKEDSIQLQWNKAAGATGYYVYQRIDGKWKKIATVKTTTYTVNKLKRFTDYEFAVKSYKKIGDKTYNATSYPTLKASTRGRTTFTWSKVSGVTGYQMQISTKSNFGSPNKIFTTTKNSQTVTGLLKDTTFYIRVRSYVTKNGNTTYSAWSSSIKFKT